MVNGVMNKDNEDEKPLVSMKKMKMVDGVLHFIVDDLGVLHLASCLILVFFI